MAGERPNHSRLREGGPFLADPGLRPFGKAIFKSGVDTRIQACYLESMQNDTEHPAERSDRLSQSDYDRLFEYRLAPRNQDLRKFTASQRSRKRRDTYRHSDPTANKAIRRVLYTSTSEGF